MSLMVKTEKGYFYKKRCFQCNKEFLGGKDHGHLIKFAKFLGFNDDIPIKYDKKRKAYYLRIASKKSVEDLIRNGFPTKNKSLTAYVPKFEDKKLIQGFLLGIFDADGSAFTSEKGKTFHISICGTLSVCKEFANFFGYEEKYIKKIKNKNLYEFKVGRQKVTEVEKFYKSLYSQAPVFLERKKKVFETFLSKKRSKEVFHAEDCYQKRWN